MDKIPVKDIVEWDVLNWSQLISLWTPILSSLPKDKKVLAIGERNGGLSLWLALMGFDVVCTDRNGITTLAKQIHKKYGVEGKIKYRSLDIVHSGLQNDQFDLIIAKSVIGGLKNDPANRDTRNFQIQQKAVNNIYDLLNPGGYYLSAENIKGSQLMKLLRRYKGKHKGWRYLSCDEIHLLCSRFSIVDVKTFGVVPGGREISGLHKILFGLNKALDFLPANLKYIAFTTAQKANM